MEKYAEGGWVTGLKYEDELRDLLMERTSGKDDEVLPPRHFAHLTHTPASGNVVAN